MDIRIRESGAVTVVEITGEIDAATAKPAQDKVLEAVKPNGKLVLDMTGVSYMSSAGVRAVRKVDQQTKAAGGRLVLAGLSNELSNMLETLGILDWIPHHDTLEGALAALSPSDGGADGHR